MRKLTLLLATVLLAQAQKASPPPPTAPRTYQFPRTVSKMLPNGLKVFVVEDHRQPLVSAAIEILAGGAYNAPEKAGLAEITAELLRQGTVARNAQEIARLTDNAGGRLGASANDDVATVSMTFMKSSAALGMELMANIVRNPSFPEAEIDRMLRQMQSGLAVAYNNPTAVAAMVADRAILGTHPYAYPDSGTPQTLRNIKRDDIVGFYKAAYAPGRAWMAIAGDLNAAEAFAMAEKYFGTWPAVDAPDVKLPAPLPSRNLSSSTCPMPCRRRSWLATPAFPAITPTSSPCWLPTTSLAAQD
jgi:zinc protease